MLWVVAVRRSDGTLSLLQSDEDSGTANPSPTPRRSVAGLLYGCQVKRIACPSLDSISSIEPVSEGHESQTAAVGIGRCRGGTLSDKCECKQSAGSSGCKEIYGTDSVEED